MFYDRENLELLSIVWLDKFGDATQENREIEETLRSIVNYVRIFDNCQSCTNYLTNQINDHDKIIFIVSGQLGQEILDHIHHLTQIISILIFCGNKPKYQLWAQNYQKVFFSNFFDLLKKCFFFIQIKSVVVQSDDLLIEIEKELKSIEYQLNGSIEILENRNEIIDNVLLIPSDIDDKRYFLNICLKFYENNSKELENVEEFEHLYNSKDSFKYLIEQKFVYRLLNRSLIELNIQMIYLLRFYLQDLHEQFNLFPTNLSKIYFGQLMKIDQIEKLNNFNENSILKFNSFIKGNGNEQIILNHLQNSFNLNGFHKVLFQIDSNGKIFENEIYFPINSSFRLISVKLEKRIWFVQLHFISNNSQINRKINSVQFAHYCRNSGYLDQSEQLFNYFLNEKPLLNYYSYEGLGRISQDKALFNQSLQFYLKSRQFVSSKELSNCLNNIGCIYDYLQQYQKAIQFYFKALSHVKTELFKAKILNNIGITFANLKDFDQSIKYFEQSLQIRKDILIENHLDIAVSLTNIALIYSSSQQFDRSLEYLNNALKIFQMNHSFLFQAIVLQNLAQIYQLLNQSNKALLFYQDSLDIFKQYKPIDHPNLAFIQQQIQFIKQSK